MQLHRRGRDLPAPPQTATSSLKNPVPEDPVQEALDNGLSSSDPAQRAYQLDLCGGATHAAVALVTDWSKTAYRDT